MAGDAAVVVLASAALAAVLWKAFAGLAEAGAAPTQPRVGRMDGAVNEVRRRHAGTLVWRDIRPGVVLHDADSIYVAGDSSARVLFDDGSRLTIAESSLVVIHRPGGRAPVVEVKRGGVTAEAGAGSLSIQSTGAQATLERGAVVVVRATPAGTRLDDLAGSVKVSAGGREVALAPRERLAVDGAGEARSPLGAELLEPRREARVYAPDRATVTFTWQAGGPGAGAEALEVARDAAFTDLAVSRPGVAPGVSEDFGPGVYHWRIRRQAGEAGEERSFAVIDDHPPRVYMPGEGEEVYVPAGTPLWLAWTTIRQSGGYTIEIAPERDFAAPDVRIASHTSATPIRAPLPEGRWCARVRLSAPDREPPWSEPRCFGVITRPRLNAPELRDPSIEDLPGGRR